jgi:glycosyltransferase involved in cell wall biosynthesis
MEYLSYGRPLLVTDCTETARIVNRAGAGVVVDDDVVAFSTGIQTIANASDEQLDAWSVAARNAAQRESWEHRARRVVELLTGPR